MALAVSKCTVGSGHFRIWKWNFNPGMGMRGTGHPQVGGCDGGGGGQQPGWGGEGGLQALAAGKLAVWNQIQVSIRFGVVVQGGQEVRGGEDCGEVAAGVQRVTGSYWVGRHLFGRLRDNFRDLWF